MPDLKLTALDGGQVTLSGPDVPGTAAGCTAFAVFSIFGRLQEFTAGDSRFARIMGESMNVEEDGTYGVANGVVRVGTGREVSPEGAVDHYKHVAWEGSRHSLGFVVYNTDTNGALAVLDAMRIEEDANGAVLVPADTRASLMQGNQHAPGINVPVSGQGLLEAFALSSFWRDKRPAWSGRSAAGGELYAERPDPLSPTMLLYGQSAVTRIYLNDKGNELAASAAALAVDWSGR